MAPVMGVLTGAYADVQKTLTVMNHHLIDKLGLRLVFVHGDQQSFSRMVYLKYSEGKLYDWLVPLPGDWHFVVHALMSIHHPKSGWWATLISWFPHVAGLCPDSIVDDWTSVEKYNTYCAFYECVILSIVQYVHDVVPPFYIDHPSVLLAMLAEHKSEGNPPPAPPKSTKSTK